jgi:hypothetical protein
VEFSDGMGLKSPRRPARERERGKGKGERGKGKGKGERERGDWGRGGR